MRRCRSLARSCQSLALIAALWLATEQPASAQALLAQSGGAKTGIGWLIVLLCVGLGLIAVLRRGVRDKKPKWGK